MTGKIVTIQKTIKSEAVRIDTPEEDAQVRTWLAGMFVECRSEPTEKRPVHPDGFFFPREGPKSEIFCESKNSRRPGVAMRSQKSTKVVFLTSKRRSAACCDTLPIRFVDKI